MGKYSMPMSHNAEATALFAALSVLSVAYGGVKVVIDGDPLIIGAISSRCAPSLFGKDRTNRLNLSGVSLWF